MAVVIKMNDKELEDYKKIVDKLMLDRKENRVKGWGVLNNTPLGLI